MNEEKGESKPLWGPSRLGLCTSRIYMQMVTATEQGSQNESFSYYQLKNTLTMLQSSMTQLNRAN